MIFVIIFHSPERVIADLGILLAGAAVVNGMCIFSSGTDLLKILRDSKSVCLILEPGQDNYVFTSIQDEINIRPNGLAFSRLAPALMRASYQDHFVFTFPQNCDGLYIFISVCLSVSECVFLSVSEIPVKSMLILPIIVVYRTGKDI